MHSASFIAKRNNKRHNWTIHIVIIATGNCLERNDKETFLLYYYFFPPKEYGTKPLCAFCVFTWVALNMNKIGRCFFLFSIPQVLSPFFSAKANEKANVITKVDRMKRKYGRRFFLVPCKNKNNGRSKCRVAYFNFKENRNVILDSLAKILIDSVLSMRCPPSNACCTQEKRVCVQRIFLNSMLNNKFETEMDWISSVKRSNVHYTLGMWSILAITINM